MRHKPDAAERFRNLALRFDHLVNPAAIRRGAKGADIYHVSQTVWVRVSSLYGRFGDLPDPIEPWLWTITADVTRRRLQLQQSQARRLRRPAKLTRLADTYDSIPYFEEEKARLETIQAVRKSIRGLNPKYKNVINLMHYENLKVGEIARRLHITTNTVRARHRMALRLLREKLQGLAERL